MLPHSSQARHKSSPDHTDVKEHLISLKDRTITTDHPTIASNAQSDAERSDSEGLAPDTSLDEPLIRKPTSSSLRNNLQQQIKRQKYARYQSYRYTAPQDDEQQPGLHTSTQPEGLLERGRAKTSELLGRKKALRQAEDREAVLDILYENQRGSFLFGIPRYSSNSLLQFDPKPWQNADFRTSAVDIRNAQVPDPDWQWVWKSWYVDMSRDVDEEGWEYSFAFAPQFAWHGNHPWFHSFVRRRRWLRRRVRRSTASKTKEKSHTLAPDYFTIHSKVVSSTLDGSRHQQLTNDNDMKDTDIEDIGALMTYLKKARIDREKLSATRKFTQQAGDDLHYLAERMPEVLSLLVYQSSRRQLLSELVQHHEEIVKRKKSLAGHNHSNDQKSMDAHQGELQKAEDLYNAITAAEAQIQELEYWSDIKDVMRSDEGMHGQDNAQKEKIRWRDVPDQDENVFRSKQAADAPTEALHDQPEGQSKHIRYASYETDSSAYDTAASVATSSNTRPSLIKTGTDVSIRQGSEDGLERFVTASEGPVSSIKAKQWPDKQPQRKRRERATHLQLDGVAEEEASGDDIGIGEDDTEMEKPDLQTVDAEEAVVRE